MTRWAVPPWMFDRAFREVGEVLRKESKGRTEERFAENDEDRSAGYGLHLK